MHDYSDKQFQVGTYLEGLMITFMVICSLIRHLQISFLFTLHLEGKKIHLKKKDPVKIGSFATRDGH